MLTDGIKRLKFTGKELITALENNPETIIAEPRIDLTIKPCTNEQLETIVDWLIQRGIESQIIRLILNNNQLTTLPKWIGQLNNLTSLRLNTNQLTTLPESMGQLSNLTELVLSFNQLTTLPEWIGQLRNLTALILSNNQLNTLPESMGQLGNLTELWLHNNHITTLPIAALTWADRLSKNSEIQAPLMQLQQEAKQLSALMSIFANLYNTALVAAKGNPHNSRPYNIKLIFFGDLLPLILKRITIENNNEPSPVFLQFTADSTGLARCLENIRGTLFKEDKLTEPKDESSKLTNPRP